MGKSLLIYILTHVVISSVIAQQQNAGISMSVQTDQNYQEHKIFSKIIRLKNYLNQDFNGFLTVDVPPGIKSISGDSIRVFIPKGDSTFLPVRMTQFGHSPAGRASITLKLLDQSKGLLRQQSTYLQIQEDNSIKLIVEEPTVYIFNNRDSIKVNVTVENLGNTSQYISVIYGIPDPNGNKIFIEEKQVIPMKSEAKFTARFQPHAHLLRHENVPVSIIVTRGNQKDPVANSVVNLRNVQSSKTFNSSESFFWGLNQSNSLTASYRQIGSFTNAFQLLGHGSLNLPVGNLELVGNLYKSNTQDEIVATNTSLSYHLNNHKLTVGNINEVLEYSLFGRGASMVLANQDNKKSLKVGFVDANYNLTSPIPLLNNGFSVFAIGKLGNEFAGNELRINTLYRESPLENANHSLVGIEGRKYLNNRWSVNYQLNGGASTYHAQNETKPSFSSALQYNGNLKTLRLNGNYYYSTDYFPGNRRGTTQINQGFLKELSRGFTVWANLFYMNLQPRYYHYASDLKTQNLLTNVGIGLPRIKRTTLNLGFQSQSEFSNTYRFIINDESSPLLSSKSNRGSLLINWISPNFRNMISIQSEIGVAKFSQTVDYKNQMKVISAYTYKWFNLNVNYQKGSYFLSEYISTLSYNREFERLSVLGNVTHNTKNWSINGGLGYAKDHVMGNTPSVLTNIKYLGNQRYHLFLNSSWHQYKFHSLPTRDLLSVETGVTFKFKHNPPSSARKGKIKVFLFLDTNGNGLRDPGETPAKDFFVNIGTSTFITDNNGSFSYSLMPYNTYQIMPIKEEGWFYEGGNIVVNKLSSQVEIALKQMGTISGEITYNFDAQRSLQIDPKVSGISFIIRQESKYISKVSTNDLGQFIEFLPTGSYQIELDVNSLSESTFCSQPIQSFEIESGKITQLQSFEIGVINRKINIKKFGN